MKKLRSKRSLFASAAPPPTVTIKGASKKISLQDMRNEYNGLLAMFAAVIEVNNGQLLIEQRVLDKVVRDGRSIKIRPAELGWEFNFESIEELIESSETAPEEASASAKPNDFLNSDTAAEARKYLAQQRKEKNDNTE